jgi:Ribbon-helix-helix protein, copG family.
VKQIKISDDVYNKLREIAEKNGGISLNNVIEMLLNLYLGGSSERTIDKILTKEFVADSEKTCSRCGKKIGVGDVVYWIKYIYTDGSKTTRYLCIECANPYLGKLYRKKKEMEIIIKQLKKEADSLVEEISKLEHVRSVYTIKNEIIQFWREFKQVFGENPDYKVVETFLDRLNELVDKVNRLEAFVETIKKDITIVKKEKAKAI